MDGSGCDVGDFGPCDRIRDTHWWCSKQGRILFLATTHIALLDAAQFSAYILMSQDDLSGQSFGNPVIQISNLEPQKILILPADAKPF